VPGADDCQVICSARKMALLQETAPQSNRAQARRGPTLASLGGGLELDGAAAEALGFEGLGVGCGRRRVVDPRDEPGGRRNLPLDPGQALGWRGTRQERRRERPCVGRA
jgi:hypothetical protein